MRVALVLLALLAPAKDEGPTALAARGEVVWVASGGGVVTRLDAGTGRRLGTPTRVSGYPSHVTASAAGVWVTTMRGGDAYEPAAGDATLIADDGRVTAKLRVPGSRAGAVAAGGSSVWVADADRERVFRFDVRARRAARTYRVAGRPWALAADTTGAWVAVDHDGTAARVVRLGTPRSLPVRPTPYDLALGHGSLWVVSLGGTVTRIRGGRVVARIAAGHSPSALAVGPRAVWVIDFRDGRSSLVRIDPRANRVVSRRCLASPFGRLDDVVWTPRGLWVANAEGWVGRVGGRAIRIP